MSLVPPNAGTGHGRKFAYSLVDQFVSLDLTDISHG